MYCFISSLLFKFVISVFRLNKQKTLVYNRDPSLRVGLSLLKRKIKKVFTWWMCRMYGSWTQTSLSGPLMYGLNRAS